MARGPAPTDRARRARGRARSAPAWWRDVDRRRAALLSGALHLLLLLVLIVALRLPEPEPVPTYLVIDVGTPAEAPEVVEAAAAQDPAPATEAPQVADDQVGEPQVATAPEPTPTTEEPEPQTAQDEAPAAAPEAEVAETPDVPTPPVPQAVVPAAAAPEVPLATLPATPLPEIDTPDLEPAPLAERIPVPLPAVATVVPEPRAIAPTPQVSVAAPAPVPTPAVAAAVEAAAPVPLPSAAAAVAPARPVAAPDVRASIAEARDVRVAPQVAVARPVPTPVPQVRAEVLAPPAPAAPAVDPLAAATETDVASARDDDRPAGGDAANPGQSGAPDPDASASALGAAAGPDGSPNPSGSPAPPRPPFAQQLERPLAVVVDNVGGYPQSGLRPASTIVEMPVEGGLTRLMLVFDRTDPERVGPVRSAREYFVELAGRIDAVLVHDGGSPGALAAIGASPLPTINSFDRGELFARGDGQAPYNLFSQGDALRAAVNRLDLSRGRTVATTIYRPASDLPAATSVSVRYGATYTTAFRFEQALDAYRWVRNGTAAVDASGEAVLVDAVLVGAIEARVFPNDTAGRLSIPLRGGAATLYVGGRAVEGRWEIQDAVGVRFVAGDEVVDLAPFKTWVVLTPTYDGRVVAAE
jgi:hypothetical protein